MLAAATFFLTGCFETTQEITLNDDGSGTLINSNDMSQLIAVAKQMGGGDMEKMPQEKLDSTFSLAMGADSIPNLTPSEIELVKRGSLHINMDMKAEKFVTQLSFPFRNPAEIVTYNTLSGKIMSETMKDQLGKGSLPSSDESPASSSFDDYYTYEFSNGELKRKLNKEKYATLDNDEYLKGMKDAGGMGMKMKANYIINLPRAAKEVEGKGVKLSNDKKQVTISLDIDDFFTDPSLLEFKIKY